jgi:hypothetical protein
MVGDIYSENIDERRMQVSNVDFPRKSNIDDEFCREGKL